MSCAAKKQKQMESVVLVTHCWRFVRALHWPWITLPPWPGLAKVQRKRAYFVPVYCTGPRVSPLAVPWSWYHACLSVADSKLDILAQRRQTLSLSTDIANQSSHTHRVGLWLARKVVTDDLAQWICLMHELLMKPIYSWCNLKFKMFDDGLLGLFTQEFSQLHKRFCKLTYLWHVGDTLCIRPISTVSREINLSSGPDRGRMRF